MPRLCFFRINLRVYILCYFVGNMKCFSWIVLYAFDIIRSLATRALSLLNFLLYQTHILNDPANTLHSYRIAQYVNSKVDPEKA